MTTENPENGDAAKGKHNPHFRYRLGVGLLFYFLLAAVPALIALWAADAPLILEWKRALREAFK